jgi:hypothetical protein
MPSLLPLALLSLPVSLTNRQFPFGTALQVFVCMGFLNILYRISGKIHAMVRLH